MEIQIRVMTVQDAAAVNELSGQLGYKLSVEETRGHIEFMLGSKEHCVRVAVVENKIVGWIHAFKTVRIETTPFIEIGGLVVDKDFRGKGIGKKLVDSISQWCEQENVNSLRVRCNTKRIEAHAFYLKTEFRETKEQKIFERKINKS
ncbi:MAG: GNAT family N-acetyltransferase [Flavisolibacter sp.]